jgi:DNA-binding response OmpR family regulator
VKDEAITRLAYELRQMAGSMMRVADAVEDLKELSAALPAAPAPSLNPAASINRSQDPDFEVLPARMAIVYKGFELEALTPREFQLLELFIRRPGILRTRKMILDIIAPEDLDVDERSVDSHVKRVRRKLEAVHPDAQRIRSRWGAGYIWESSRSSPANIFKDEEISYELD